MSTPPNKQLLEWIRKRRVDLTPDGMIARIELWHVIDGEGGTPLSTFEMADRPEDEDPDDLTQEIWNDAEEDAGTRPQGSYQRYMVRAFREGEHTAEESKAFICHGRALSNLIGSDSESATPRGLIAQERRQNDNLHAMVIRMADNVANTLERRTALQNAEIETLYAQRRASFEMEIRMRDREHERQQEREDRERSAARVDQLMTTGLKLFEALGPIIIGKLLAGPGAPAAAGPLPGGVHPRVAEVMARDAAVSSVLEGLDFEQVKAISSSLRPEQQLAFLELYKSYSEAAAAKEQTDSNEESSHEQESH